MNIRIRLVSIFAIFLTACATVPPQSPVELKDSAIGVKGGRIGVAMATLPKIDTEFPGADCLLCIAAASTANSTLTAHTQKLPYEELLKLKNAVADALRKKGTDVTVIPDDIKTDDLADFAARGLNVAKKDFSSLKQKYQIDRLVVFQISALGMRRNYSSYIPTSDPKAALKGTGYLVNLANNTYEWYHSVNIVKSTDGAWDEPPNFPGLTNAYFQVLELGKDSFLEPFNRPSNISVLAR